MSLIKLVISISFLLFSSNLYSKEDVINLQLKDGIVKIKTFEDKAPKHVKQITDLVAKGSYDGVVFHRVIDGFMAQSGDVKFGNSNSPNFNLSLAVEICDSTLFLNSFIYPSSNLVSLVSFSFNFC